VYEFSQIFSQVSQLKIKSITDSLFKYALLFAFAGIVPAIFTEKDWISIVLFSVSGFFAVLGMGFYFYFAIKKPDYLRSENYQLSKQAFELLGDNDRASNKNLKNLPAIMNPHHKRNEHDLGNPLNYEQ